MKVSVLLGAFFVNEARNNNNKFKMEDRNNYYFIDNYGNTTNYYNYDSISEVLYFAKNETREEPKNKKKIDYLFYYIGAGILGIIILVIAFYLIFGKTKNSKNPYFELLSEI